LACTERGAVDAMRSAVALAGAPIASFPIHNVKQRSLLRRVSASGFILVFARLRSCFGGRADKD
jgi:hypothetical protein